MAHLVEAAEIHAQFFNSTHHGTRLIVQRGREFGDVDFAGCGIKADAIRERAADVDADYRNSPVLTHKLTPKFPRVRGGFGNADRPARR